MAQPAPDPTSRELILDAAERLFAGQGFARTTVKHIGRAAGVNSALLYYYFADKDRLYREVLQRFVSRLVTRTMSAAGDDAEAAVRAFVAAQADTVAASPHAPRLFARELIDYDAAHAVQQVHLMAVTSFRRLCGLIEEGQQAGLFRRDWDPRFAAISTIAQVAYFSIARPAVRVLLQERTAASPDRVLREFARHAAEFAVAALSSSPVRRPRRGRGRRPRSP
ncbi:MAG: TetR/AcrR family transcriptional regulator [Gemmatimonadales bacterium]